MSYRFLPTCPKHNEIAVDKDGNCPACAVRLRWDSALSAWVRMAEALEARYGGE